ncbi:MAG: phosphatidylglycerol---prolipoprotein diacylglyceryl transferase [Chloroflexia bacterium]|jgi:phosphatidylglycerol:prolipoprotein diacylglycerol transferase|nr:phosphatidylglycerol---prolipoprotein diacylglyceryl transferase [Chloroflexia bacterium]
MPDRVAFTVFGIPVYWYGIMIMLGVLAASYVAFVEARRRGEDTDHVWQLFPWALIAGILGARIGWIVSEASNRQFSDIWSLIDVRQGGLSIQGTIIGGALAVILYCRRYKLSFFKWVDIIAPGLALGQAIGRWGNFFNQEAFGAPTTLPWGIQIDVRRQAEVAGPNAGFTPSSDLRFHPTFAYEMIWNLLNMGILLWLGRQRRIRLREGDIFWIYLIFYSVGRYAIEEIRVDSAMVSGFKAPQLFSIIAILLALVMIAIRHRPNSKVPWSATNLPLGTTVPTQSSSVALADDSVESRTPRVRRVAKAARRRSAATTTTETSGASTE